MQNTGQEEEVERWVEGQGKEQVRGEKEPRSRKLSQGNQTERINVGRGRGRMTDSRNIRKEDWKL